MVRINNNQSYYCIDYKYKFVYRRYIGVEHFKFQVTQMLYLICVEVLQILSRII